MAVKNSITNRPKEAVTEFKVGEESIKLSPGIVRKYLVNGDGNVTDQEIMMFIGLCKYQHLNPFLREAYLIKYGNQAATIVTGKEAITKRAMRNERFAGQQAGVVVYIADTDELEYRHGSMVMKERSEILVGGWAKVFVKGYDVPIEAVVSFDEYVGRKKDGSVNSQWAKKPATMIRKVALMQALREAFPEDLVGMYATEEMGVSFDESAVAPVEQPDVIQPETQQQPETPPTIPVADATTSTGKPEDTVNNTIRITSGEQTTLNDLF